VKECLTPRLLAHECRHVYQCEVAGSESRSPQLLFAGSRMRSFATPAGEPHFRRALKVVS
jgi:hypothetical protein